MFGGSGLRGAVSQKSAGFRSRISGLKWELWSPNFGLVHAFGPRVNFDPLDATGLQETVIYHVLPIRVQG